MTLGTISTAIYRRVKLADSPATSDVTRIQQFVNLWYRRMMAAPGMGRFRDTTLTFTTVASQKKYAMPQALSRISNIYDLTNQRRILPRSVDWLRNVDPGLTATSSFTQNWLGLYGWSAELVEPASTGIPLYVVSDNAGDTQTAYVETTRLGGIRAGTTSVSVNGITRAQLGAKSDHIEVVKFYLSQAATGTVSLYDAAASGNILSQITPGRTNARYFMIQLYPTSGAAVTLNVDGQRTMEDLANTNEEPLFPEDYHLALVEFGCYEEWRNRQDERMKDAYTEGMRIWSDLRHSVETTPDEIPVQRGPRGQAERVSRLGGFYPSDGTNG